MPTGYTAIVSERDVTFEEFVWRCARGMSANVLMREEPMEALPVRYEPSDYNVKALELARGRLYDLERMTLVEAERGVAEDHERTVTACNQVRDASIVEAGRYRSMLAKVREWTPPTTHHFLKAFMIEQLESSLRFDCSDMPMPERLSGKEWLRREVVKARRDIAYHEEAQQKEIENTNARNRWNDDLRASVPFPVKP